MAIALRSTAIGAFASRAEAEQAVCDLLGAEFGSDQVGIVLPDAVAPAAGSEEAGPTALWAGPMFRSLIGEEIPTARSATTRRPSRTADAGDGPGRDRYPEAIDILHRCGGKYMAAF